MSNENIKILVYGYGNPGRQDDGLGNALVSLVEQAQFPNVDIDSNYQLNIEDADNISKFDAVIFVDASTKDDPPFSFTNITPAGEIRFTTHSMGPDSVLALCHDIYDKIPDAYLLAIPGYEWKEMHEGLTEKAKENLEKAFEFISSLLKKSSLESMSSAAK